MPPGPQDKPPPSRHLPPPSHPVRPVRANLTEQGTAASQCEQHGYGRDRGEPEACNRASEQAWPNPFPGAASPPGATPRHVNYRSSV